MQENSKLLRGIFFNDYKDTVLFLKIWYVQKIAAKKLDANLF